MIASAKLRCARAGMPKPTDWKRDKQTPRQNRYNANCDGPALTWASFNSGCAYVCHDPVRRDASCSGEPAGIPVADSPAEETYAALASAGAGGLLCACQKAASGAKIAVFARILRTR